MQSIAARRSPISRVLLTLGTIGLAILAATISTVSSADAPLLVGKVLGIGVLTACCFGGWQIVRFAVTTPPARRSDIAYLALFAIWVCWTMLGAGVFLYDSSG